MSMSASIIIIPSFSCPFQLLIIPSDPLISYNLMSLWIHALFRMFCKILFRFHSYYIVTNTIYVRVCIYCRHVTSRIWNTTWLVLENIPLNRTNNRCLSITLSPIVIIPMFYSFIIHRNRWIMISFILYYALHCHLSAALKIYLYALVQYRR